MWDIFDLVKREFLTHDYLENILKKLTEIEIFLAAILCNVI